MSKPTSSMSKPDESDYLGRSCMTETELRLYDESFQGERLLPGNDTRPSPKMISDGWMVGFKSCFDVGLVFPLHPLLISLMETYGVQLNHLSPEAILRANIFRWLYESTFQTPPLEIIFHNIFSLEKKQSIHGSFGCVTINVRKARVNDYPVLTYPNKKTEMPLVCTEHPSKWFYFRLHPANRSACAQYVPGEPKLKVVPRPSLGKEESFVTELKMVRHARSCRDLLEEMVMAQRLPMMALTEEQLVADSSAQTAAILSIEYARKKAVHLLGPYNGKEQFHYMSTIHEDKIHNVVAAARGLVVPSREYIPPASSKKRKSISQATDTLPGKSSLPAKKKPLPATKATPAKVIAKSSKPSESLPQKAKPTKPKTTAPKVIAKPREQTDSSSQKNTTTSLFARNRSLANKAQPKQGCEKGAKEFASGQNDSTDSSSSTSTSSSDSKSKSTSSTKSTTSSTTSKSSCTSSSSSSTSDDDSINQDGVKGNQEEVRTNQGNGTEVALLDVDDAKIVVVDSEDDAIPPVVKPNQKEVKVTSQEEVNVVVVDSEDDAIPPVVKPNQKEVKGTSQEEVNGSGTKVDAGVQSKGCHETNQEGVKRTNQELVKVNGTAAVVEQQQAVQHVLNFDEVHQHFDKVSQLLHILRLEDTEDTLDKAHKELSAQVCEISLLKRELEESESLISLADNRAREAENDLKECNPELHIQVMHLHQVLKGLQCDLCSPTLLGTSIADSVDHLSSLFDHLGGALRNYTLGVAVKLIKAGVSVVELNNRKEKYKNKPWRSLKLQPDESSALTNFMNTEGFEEAANGFVLQLLPDLAPPVDQTHPQL